MPAMTATADRQAFAPCLLSAGFLPLILTPVARAIACCRDAGKAFRNQGAMRHVVVRGGEVPAGEHASFPMAAKLGAGESVALSRLIRPDKGNRGTCFAGVDANPGFAALQQMPIGGRRMILGGFAQIMDKIARALRPRSRAGHRRERPA